MSSSQYAAGSFLDGAGEMAQLIRATDWSRTPLGSVETWPQSLRTTVSLCLASNFPINIIWGPQHTQIYNDGYRVVCGEAHPRALGEGYDVTWASAWPAIGGPFVRALAGETSYLENQRMFLTRNGYLEETFFTFSLSPIRDESGGIGGVFHPVTETTATMLGERRTRAVRDLTARLGGATSAEQVVERAIKTLADFAFDVPFVLFYQLASDTRNYHLAGMGGIGAGSASPEVLSLTASTPWPVATLISSSQAIEINELRSVLGDAQCGPYEESPDTAVALPIAVVGSSLPMALLIAGASSRLPFDETYRGFFDLIAAAVSAALANVRALEEERKRADVLAEADRAKTSFFSNVSHEFRTPLTLMLGPLEESLAESDRLPKHEVERVSVAHRNGLRLLKLVNSLLDFSRIEAGRAQAVYQPTDIATFTAEVASTFRSATQRAGLDLVVDAQPLHQTVYIDRHMWETVVLNLLSNAFKFTWDGEIRVVVRRSRNGAMAEVIVSDTGGGIPAEELPRLFERFHRVAGVKGRSIEGTGIGLALVQELVRLHGGQINVQSILGEGSSFTVTLPFGSAHLSAAQIKPDASLQPASSRASAYVGEALQWLPDPADGETVDAPPLGAPLKGVEQAMGRVLLADDNADMRRYVQRLLVTQGFEVEAVGDGVAALAAARLRPPDLVLSDVMMPGLDGFGLLAALRADPESREIPMILLSARAGEEARVDALAAGADDYLIKPFVARELVARVATNINLVKSRRGAAVRASEERYRSLVEATSSVVWNTPANGEFESEQSAWSAYTGQSFAELKGWGWRNAVHPDDRAKTLSAWLNALATKSMYEIEHRLRRRDGEYRRMQVRAVPIFAADGAVREWVGIHSDVHDRREAEERLRQLNLTLEERVHAATLERQLALEKVHEMQKLETIGQLTGGIAHDFNNLLTPIVGALDMLRRKLAGDDRAQRLTAGGLQAADRARTLIQRLLAFGRRQHLQVRTIDVAALIVGMEDLMSRSLGPHIKLQIKMADALPAAKIDPNQLELALLNLAVNARDAMPGGGVLTIASEEQLLESHESLSPGKYIRLSVSDTGCGMDADTLKRAVEPFFTTKGVGRGTGLGLSMVHGLAGQSGGEFTMTSTPGLGTTAMLLLPVSDEAAPQEASGSESELARAAHRATVLLVDDEELVRYGTADMLTELGYAVTQAASGIEALQLVKSGSTVDILVTDYAMPGMSGADLAKELRQLRPELPVLMITGYASLSDREAGGLPRLAKPFRQSELAAQVAELLATTTIVQLHSRAHPRIVR